MRHHIGALVRVWKARRKFSVYPEPAFEQAFLPGALEILERPPSPIGRSIVWVIMLLLVVTCVWAASSKVEVVAVARGRIIPGGMSKVIQPLEMGVVRAIEVREGQSVTKGDLLIRLDTDEDEAQARIIERQVDGLQRDRARLSALIARIESEQYGLPTPGSPPGLSTDRRALEHRLYHRQLERFQSRLGVLENRLHQQQAELDATQARVEKLDSILPLVSRRAEKLASLTRKKMLSELQYLEREQERIEVRQELAAERSNLVRRRAALSETGNEREVLISSTGGRWLEEMSEVERRLDNLKQELAKVRGRIGRGMLVAPVSGVVQQLSVHTLGGVVKPAEPLMRIVPDEVDLEVEALLANKDVGFVTAQQRADIKVDAFPFTRYGTVAARVVNISGDAVEHESMGLAYALRLKLEESSIRTDRRSADLNPGMAVTVEITTGRRRLIDYFLSPLMRYSDESVRER